MFFPAGNNAPTKTTSHKVVLPFYLYGALSLLTATIFILFSGNDFSGHYFNPHLLAITHMVALGWGTMIILGAGHQLVPVLIEGRLYSNALAMASFTCGAAGIPLLVYGFYTFNMGWPARRGGELVFAAMVFYLLNMGMSISRSKKENIHALFVFTAVTWLMLTGLVGLTLVYNFTTQLLPADSLHYLALHAHLGIVGWFLLMVMGVGSRLIPMFLISKYTDVKSLRLIYYLVNGALLFFTIQFLFSGPSELAYFPLAAVLTAVFLFIRYIREAYKLRLRKKADDPLKLTLLSVAMIAIPVLMLLFLIGLTGLTGHAERIALTYGFIIFFGWLTAIILGMTFKTLPFIVWNKVYHLRASSGPNPGPKDLFSDRVFRMMALFYMPGFLLFAGGIIFNAHNLLMAGAICLTASAFLYNLNVFKIITHQPAK